MENQTALNLFQSYHEIGFQTLACVLVLVFYKPCFLFCTGVHRIVANGASKTLTASAFTGEERAASTAIVVALGVAVDMSFSA